MTTPPLVGLAHGSRHPRGGEAIERLVATAGRTADVPAVAAYLDLAEPDLTQAVRDLAAAGHRRAVVVPLLFTVAFHATVDVPQALEAAAQESGVELLLAEILGTDEQVADLLQGGLTAAGVPEGASVLLFAVGSSRAAANEAVADLADRLAGARGTPVRAAFGTCDPKPDTVLADLPAPVAVLPLFLAEGLLLDPVRRLAAERGWTMVEPVGERAADLVLRRYRAAVPG